MSAPPSQCLSGSLACGVCGDLVPSWCAAQEHYKRKHTQDYKDQPLEIREGAAKEKRDKRLLAKKVKREADEGAVDHPERTQGSASDSSSWWAAGYWRESSHDCFDSWQEAHGWDQVGSFSKDTSQKTFSVVDAAQNLYTDGHLLFKMVVVPWDTIKSQHDNVESTVPQAALPKFPQYRVKEQYVSCPPPPTMDDGKKAQWPIKISGTPFDFTAFTQHLVHDRAVFKGQIEKHVLGMTRVLFAFEGPDGEPIPSDSASRVDVLVSLFNSEELERLFTLPLFAPVYSWTRDALSAVQSYGKWLVSKAKLCLHSTPHY